MDEEETTMFAFDPYGLYNDEEADRWTAVATIWDEVSA